jgi:hypothetical protein
MQNTEEKLPMNDSSKKLIKLGIFALLLFWVGFLYARKIDLATADLGRHLQNGRWVVENHFNLSEKNSPLFENYYSYTHPDFKVINHHWGSGMIFFFIWKLFDFSGLSLFYIFLSLVAFSLFFYVAFQESDFTLALLLAFFLAPLMAERTEVRPEIFSVLFGALFLFLLWEYFQEKISGKWLLFLGVLQVFWVNLHVYFFLGGFLVGAFWFSEIIHLLFQRLTDEEFARKTKKVKVLTIILFLVFLAALINPFGFEGLFYPVKIFKNYGYTIVENKSVSFVKNYGIVDSNFTLIKIVLTLVFLSFVLLFGVDRRKISLPYLIFSVFFGVLGWMAIRNFTLLGFFALPVLAYNFSSFLGQKEGERNLVKEKGIAILYIILVMVGLWGNFEYLNERWEKKGIGLMSGATKAAEFFQKEGLKGPLFNNYDLGGYLIFSLFPEEKVFVDNRPEAYPDSFFSEVYKPMQEKADVFKKADQQYNFNAVFFYRNDITPWGMNFLKIIREDPEWALVYEDNYALIYLKKNEENRDLINKYKE